MSASVNELSLLNDCFAIDSKTSNFMKHWKDGHIVSENLKMETIRADDDTFQQETMTGTFLIDQVDSKDLRIDVVLKNTKSSSKSSDCDIIGITESSEIQMFISKEFKAYALHYGNKPLRTFVEAYIEYQARVDKLSSKKLFNVFLSVADILHIQYAGNKRQKGLMPGQAKKTLDLLGVIPLDDIPNIIIDDAVEKLLSNDKQSLRTTPKAPKMDSSVLLDQIQKQLVKMKDPKPSSDPAAKSTLKTDPKPSSDPAAKLTLMEGLHLTLKKKFKNANPE